MGFEQNQYLEAEWAFKCTDPVRLDEFGHSEYADTQKTVAKNSNTLPKTLLWLAEKGDEITKMELCRNPRTTPEILEILRKDKSDRVVSWIVDSPSITKELLRKLAGHKSRRVRWNVLANSKTPIDVFFRFNNRPKNYKDALANNPTCPEGLLLKICKYPDVRSSILKNPAVTAKIVSRIYDLGPSYVSAKALRNPKFPQERIVELNFQKGLPREVEEALRKRNEENIHL